MQDKVQKMSPEIRFKGYTDDWVLRKLGEVTSIYDGTHQTPSYKKQGIIFLSVENIKTLCSDKFISKESFKKEFKVYPTFHDILMTRIGDVGTSNVVTSNDKIAYYVSLALLKPKKVESYFLNASISSNEVQRELWKRTLHIAFPKKINKNEIEKVPIKYPNLFEQQAIGSLFKKLDDLITLQQRKIDTLKLLKKALLQQIFPEKEEDIPRVRFANFSTKWKQRKLGELCDITTGKLDANAMKENGQYDFYTSGIKKYKIDNYAFVGPAITIAGNGATVGYMHLADYYFNAYQRTYVLTNFTANRLFLYVEIGVKLPKKIKTEARTGNIPYIVMDMLKTLKISVSSVGEQNQIGNCLNTFEQTVIVTSQKFKKLNQLKKTLLQNMFI
ncbi:restriction endonuclease subunit S [Pediococcus pentosaceus]